MVASTSIRQGSWKRDFNNNKDLTFMRPFHLWWKPTIISIIMTLALTHKWVVQQFDIKMPYWMVIYKKRFICNNNQTSPTLILTWCENCKKPCMAWNTLKEHGMRSFIRLWFTFVSLQASLTTIFSYAIIIRWHCML